MITREEALKWAAAEDYSSGRTAHVKFINKIYDSMCHCAQCSNYSIGDGYCRILQIDGIDKNFGCVECKPRKRK